ncbi:MAG: transcriptional repressor [Desulfovibrio sp.]|jgi:Fur family ferric uptake transcriptional regulator|nr:transcriptional repressor [Desulfovibrio sp.]
MAKTRMTRQRKVILQTLQGLTSHPTADEIYGLVREKLPRISLGTVYRNLDLLTGSGQILCLDRVGAQKHFDGDTRRHHHVRCRVCGKIGDVFSPVADIPLPEGPVPGFSLQEADLIFVGVCGECGGSADICGKK